MRGIICLKKYFVVVICLCAIGIIFLNFIQPWHVYSGVEMDLYHPYVFQTARLSNGLQVLLVQDDTLPHISYEILFKGGTKRDPSNKAGLTAILAGLMNKGTRQRNAVQLAADLELLGSEFEASIDPDFVSFSVEALSWLSSEVLAIFAEMITQTVFSKEEFNRIQEKTIGRVKRSSEHFSYYASRIFNKYVFSGSPYGFYPNGTLKSLKHIQKKDVQAMYQKQIRPELALLGVAGRLPKNILQDLEKTFGAWSPVKPPKESLKKSTPSIAKDSSRLWLVNHPAAVQSEIRIGHLSVHASHKDFLKLQLANNILGGGMTSRLMHRIRVQKGLTYGVYSAFATYKELGVFKSGMAVRNDRVGDALLEILAVVKAFYKQGITEKEFKEAKEQLKTRFIKHTSTVEDFMSYLMVLDSRGLTYSYAASFIKNIYAFSLDEVNAAIQQHLHPDQLKILIFSKASDITPQLQDYQPMTVKDYTELL